MASGEYRVDYAEISRVYRMERKDALTELPGDFYSRAREYIESLVRAEKEGGQLSSDLIHTALMQIREARKLLANIWEFRTRKIALIAVSQRKSEEFRPRGLAVEEEDFLNRLLDAIRGHEAASLSGRSQPPIAVKEVETSPPPAPPAAKETAVQERPAAGEVRKTAEQPAAVGRLVFLRFVSDAPRFATEFGEFEIRKEEAALLPEAYARVLVGRKVAAEVETSAALH